MNWNLLQARGLTLRPNLQEISIVFTTLPTDVLNKEFLSLESVFVGKAVKPMQTRKRF